jgi:hypothetical protein
MLEPNTVWYVKILNSTTIKTRKITDVTKHTVELEDPNENDWKDKIRYKIEDINFIEQIGN